LGNAVVAIKLNGYLKIKMTVDIIRKCVENAMTILLN
jgi:hypothetical protein